MKVYYDYENNEILTEEEAIEYVKKEFLDDDYVLWEFISNNVCYNEIIDNLSQDFLKDITEELTKNQLKNPDYFLVREFPD